MPTEPPVLQLRLVIEAADFDAAVAFYRDVLGLPEQAAFEGAGDARVIILDAGRATLEIANPAQRLMIDEVETGRDVHGAPRIAVEVRDARATVARLAEAGAAVLGAPAETPWRSLNARLEGPAGIQLTVFQELASLEDRTSGEGFGTADDRGS
jgi:catechol 2,3-dioxygenase-like lactoylglutathione lyase family enzyme